MAGEFGNKRQALEQVARDRPGEFLQALVDTAQEQLDPGNRQALLQGIMARLGLDTLPASVPESQGKRFLSSMTILGEASGDPEAFNTAENAEAIANITWPSQE